MLESREAARRLNVKLSTLYAYVSRGLLVSHPSEDPRRRLFDVKDIEQLARRSRGGRRVDTRLATVTTGITQIRDDGPYYRGHSVVDLAETSSFEEVFDLLTGSGPEPTEWVPAAIAPRPPVETADNVIRFTTLLCGASNEFRADLRRQPIITSARQLITTIVDQLSGGRNASNGGREGVIARHVAHHLIPSHLPAERRRRFDRAVDAALILLADHELATSTMAVRIAASTRANLYDAILAGLGTLSGPLHGGASRLAYALLNDAEDNGVGRAVEECLRWQGTLPGFGHAVYQGGDPRADALFQHFRRLASRERRTVVESLIELAAEHRAPKPNVDLALAALTWAMQLAPDAGQTIFTVARLAGWTAHYLEEIEEPPLRFRVRAVYATAGRLGTGSGHHQSDGHHEHGRHGLS